MDLANPKGRDSVGTSVTSREDSKFRCQLSKALEDAGDYERAREALGGLWHRVGERPDLTGLDAESSAELLMRAGALTGWIGSSRQIDGSQEEAKNLLSEAATAFESLGRHEKVAEAQTELAYCYWRQGAFDEARVVLREALSRLSPPGGELRALALIRLSIVERTANRYDVALELLDEAAPCVESCGDALKGRFHNQRATTLENFGRATRRSEVLDRALIEYEAASFHFEQAGHARFRARVENNLGFLFHTLDRHAEAHDHLARARSLFVKLKDTGSTGQVDETLARVFIAEGRFDEAERSARSAVRSLEAGGEKALLAEALTTLGVALARAGRHADARADFERAVETAESAGDPEGAGQSALALLEELGGRLSGGELCEVYERASNLLAASKNPATLARLSACARRALKALACEPGEHEGDEHASPEERWKGFSLKREVLNYESELISRALSDAGGVVSRAAKLLGFRHHQTFVALLNNRHKELQHARSPIVPRRRPAARLRGTRRPAHHRADREAKPVSILFVEDNRVVADAIRDTLEFEGWRVEACHDGTSALARVEGADHFDLFLLDEDLPGMSGLEITRLARGLAHRSATPIVVISATDCKAAARAAGADTFLRKPQDVLAIVPTITRLLALKAAV